MQVRVINLSGLNQVQLENSEKFLERYEGYGQIASREAKRVAVFPKDATQMEIAEWKRRVQWTHPHGLWLNESQGRKSFMLDDGQ